MAEVAVDKRIERMDDRAMIAAMEGAGDVRRGGGRRMRRGRGGMTKRGSGRGGTRPRPTDTMEPPSRKGSGGSIRHFDRSSSDFSSHSHFEDDHPEESDFDNTNLYVKGLWKDCTQVELDDLFKRHGVIQQSRVYGDGVGFVRYATGDSAKRAIDEMHGKKVDSRIQDALLVKFAYRKTRNPKRLIRVGEDEVEMIMNKNTNNVYLRCLPRGFVEQDLQELCSPFGELTCTRMRESGVAFVRFRRYQDAAIAIGELNGKRLPQHGPADEPLLAKLANSDPFQPKIGFRQSAGTDGSEEKRVIMDRDMTAAMIAAIERAGGRVPGGRVHDYHYGPGAGGGGGGSRGPPRARARGGRGGRGRPGPGRGAKTGADMDRYGDERMPRGGGPDMGPGPDGYGPPPPSGRSVGGGPSPPGRYRRTPGTGSGGRESATTEDSADTPQDPYAYPPMHPGMGGGAAMTGAAAAGFDPSMYASAGSYGSMPPFGGASYGGGAAAGGPPTAADPFGAGYYGAAAMNPYLYGYGSAFPGGPQSYDPTMMAAAMYGFGAPSSMPLQETFGPMSVGQDMYEAFTSAAAATGAGGSAAAPASGTVSGLTSGASTPGKPLTAPLLKPGLSASSGIPTAATTPASATTPGAPSESALKAAMAATTGGKPLGSSSSLTMEGTKLDVPSLATGLSSGGPLDSSFAGSLFTPRDSFAPGSFMTPSSTTPGQKGPPFLFPPAQFYMDNGIFTPRTPGDGFGFVDTRKMATTGAGVGGAPLVAGAVAAAVAAASKGVADKSGSKLSGTTPLSGVPETEATKDVVVGVTVPKSTVSVTAIAGIPAEKGKLVATSSTTVPQISALQIGAGLNPAVTMAMLSPGATTDPMAKLAGLGLFSPDPAAGCTPAGGTPAAAVVGAATGWSMAGMAMPGVVAGMPPMTATGMMPALAGAMASGSEETSSGGGPVTSFGISAAVADQIYAVAESHFGEKAPKLTGMFLQTHNEAQSKAMLNDPSMLLQDLSKLADLLGSVVY